MLHAIFFLCNFQNLFSLQFVCCLSSSTFFSYFLGINILFSLSGKEDYGHYCGSGRDVEDFPETDETEANFFQSLELQSRKGMHFVSILLCNFVFVFYAFLKFWEKKMNKLIFSSSLKYRYLF